MHVTKKSIWCETLILFLFLSTLAQTGALSGIDLAKQTLKFYLRIEHEQVPLNCK